MPKKPQISSATLTSAARLVDQRIRERGGWRGETLARMRALVLQADRGMIEEWKWSNPVWSHHGIVCTGEAYARVVKLTFAKGASLADPSQLFNASLEGSTRRAIDIREGETVDARAFKALVKSAVAHNAALKRGSDLPKGKEKREKKEKKEKKERKERKETKAEAKPVRLLSGGNPQIAKADGDAPVQAYIAAMPDWKRGVGMRLDALIVRSVPNVRKAVKWNSPLYGVEGRGWFVGWHTFARYVKVTFFRGTSLRPIPPDPSKVKDTRYLNLREDDELDEAQLMKWFKQAAALPGFLGPASGR